MTDNGPKQNDRRGQYAAILNDTFMVMSRFFEGEMDFKEALDRCDRLIDDALQRMADNDKEDMLKLRLEFDSFLFGFFKTKFTK